MSLQYPLYYWEPVYTPKEVKEINKNIKNIAIPFLFILTFLLVLFNKTDYFLVTKMKSTSIDIVNPISKFIYYPIKLSINPSLLISISLQNLFDLHSLLFLPVL